MLIKITVAILLFPYASAVAQTKRYEDSLLQFRNGYIANHEILKGQDKKLLDFFPVNKTYAVIAEFEKIQQVKWLELETSGNQKSTYRPFGILHFKLNNIPFRLSIYQSKDLLTRAAYADYLFVPFTDSTNGGATYENGRYIDFRLSDIKDNKILLDFNKCYNPYCAYVSGMFNCPIPPAENNLTTFINAGEKKLKRKGQN